MLIEKDGIKMKHRLLMQIGENTKISSFFFDAGANINNKFISDS